MLGKPVAGDIVMNFYDLQGRIAQKAPFDDRMMCVSAAQLQATPKVIGVGGGEDKEWAIVGAARAGLIKEVVTDHRNAERSIQLWKSSRQINRPLDPELTCRSVHPVSIYFEFLRSERKGRRIAGLRIVAYVMGRAWTAQRRGQIVYLCSVRSNTKFT